MLKSFMKTTSACMTGISIGGVGALTAIFNFDPVQLVVSTILIVTEVMILLDIRGDE